MTIPVVLTKIKKRIEANTHLDQKSKLIVLHVIRQVFKEIPKEELINGSNEFYPDGTFVDPSSFGETKSFEDIFPWLRGDK